MALAPLLPIAPLAYLHLHHYLQDKVFLLLTSDDRSGDDFLDDDRDDDCDDDRNDDRDDDDDKLPDSSLLNKMLVGMKRSK